MAAVYQENHMASADPQSTLYDPDASSRPAGYGPSEQTPAHSYSNLNQQETAGPPKPDGSTGRWGRNMTKKQKQRLYWIIPLLILVLVLVILFEVFKSDFERWVSPLADWLRARESWSWVIPVAILFVLSFPPLFGHEIVLIVVGLTYPLGVAIGIACAGAILGEAACFIVFKYCFTGYVEKRIRQRVRWAAIARVSREAGYRGVLLIRYSIVPPHLANPLFSCTGMKFWVYMTTVVLSIPKTIVFVALGAPSSEGKEGAKVGKVIAIGVVVIISIFATRWIRIRLSAATKEIEAERAGDPARLDMPQDEAYESQVGTPNPRLK